MFIGNLLVVAFLKLMLIRHASAYPVSLCENDETFDPNKGCVPVKNSRQSVSFEVNYEERRRRFPSKLVPKHNESEVVAKNPSQVEAIQNIMQTMIDNANCSLGTSYQLMSGCMPHQLKPDMLNLGLKPNDTLESLFNMEHLQNKIVEDLSNKFEDILPENLKLDKSDLKPDLKNKDEDNKSLVQELPNEIQDNMKKMTEIKNILPKVEQIIHHGTAQESDNTENHNDQAEINNHKLEETLNQHEGPDETDNEAQEIDSEDADNLTEKYPFIIDDNDAMNQTNQEHSETLPHEQNSDSKLGQIDLNDPSTLKNKKINISAEPIQTLSTITQDGNISSKEPQRIQVKQKIRADSISKSQEIPKHNEAAIRRFDDNQHLIKEPEKNNMQFDAISQTEKSLELKETTEKISSSAETQDLESNAPNSTAQINSEVSTTASVTKSQPIVTVKQNSDKKPIVNNKKPEKVAAPGNNQLPNIPNTVKNKTASFIGFQAHKLLELPMNIVNSQKKAAKSVIGNMLGMSRRQAISIPMQDSEDINEIRAKYPPAEYQYNTVENKVLEGGDGFTGGDQEQENFDDNQEALDLGRSASKSKRQSMKPQELKSTSARSENQSTSLKSSTIQSSTNVESSSTIKSANNDTKSIVSVAPALQTTKLD